MDKFLMVVLGILLGGAAVWMLDYAVYTEIFTEYTKTVVGLHEVVNSKQALINELIQKCGEPCL